MIHSFFLHPGETITADRYCCELDIMHRNLSTKQPALVNRRGPILFHDNARPHGARVTIQKLHQLGYETLPHPPYSPDLSPTDYHFFKHLDTFLGGKKFQNQTSVETAFQEFIESRSSRFFHDGIHKLVSRWQKCVAADGAYFD